LTGRKAAPAIKEDATEQSFLLSITVTENSEWQGHITEQNARPAEFQSVMELLKSKRRELEETK